jgi:RES domain-containing protein
VVGISFNGLVYRALNPAYAKDPYSGEGARLYGGRFNPKGTLALYLSLSPVTALREANQVGHLQPTLMLAYEARIDELFNATDMKALEKAGMTPEKLADSGWRDQMLENSQAYTQIFSASLIKKGFKGVLVRSFAKGSKAEDLNLVLWQWNTSSDCQLKLVDAQNRLGR